MDERPATHQRGTGKELPALLACLVWAGGFELAPALHLIAHAELAPHVHEHDGERHVHDGDEPPTEHGESSLAHRGLAAHTPPPALPPFDPPQLGAVRFERTPPRQAPSRTLEGPRARGPPHVLPLA